MGTEQLREHRIWVGDEHTCQHLSSKIREISAAAVAVGLRGANVGFEGCCVYLYMYYVVFSI